MARRGNAAASGFSGQRLHDVRADDRQRRADHIAHEGHQDADGSERTGVGAGEDRRGGRAADVGERGHARAVKRSSLRSLQMMSISTAWMPRTMKLVAIQAGASPSSSRLAREASRPMTA